MASELYWFYDVLILGIFLVAIYLGARRGLMKSVVLIALTVLSVVASWMGAQIASPIVYDKFIKDAVLDRLYDASDSSDPTRITSDVIKAGDYGVEISDDDLTSIAEAESDYFSALASEIKKNGASETASEIQDNIQDGVTEQMLTSLLGDWLEPSTITEIVESLNGTAQSITDIVSVFIKGNRESTALAFEESILAPVIKGLLRVLFFVLLLIICKLIIGPISELFKGVNKIPIIGPVNVLCGGALGLVEGVLIVYAVSLGVKLAVYLTEGSLMFINNETIDKTYIFKLIYNLDLTKFG